MHSTVTTPVLHHVNLKTSRLQEMIDWYGLVVGMHPNHEYPGGAWLTNDSANHRLALLTVPGLEDDPDKLGHAGMHHMAFEYPSLDALLDTYVRLRVTGLTPHACLDHGMTTSFYYVDPDGNSVELQADNFDGDWSQSTQFMYGPEFIENPIGLNIDAELLVSARDQGATTDQIRTRSRAGEFESGTPLDLRLPGTTGPAA